MTWTLKKAEVALMALVLRQCCHASVENTIPSLVLDPRIEPLQESTEQEGP